MDQAIKELKDEDWKPSSIFWEIKNRRADERTISYCESHDQALVGDKTIIFRLIDADMYWHFKKGDENYMAHRGIALHKMIRLATISTINGGYLNFMGNEFGHPEWIDFPREGNGWSHKYARRQWNLVDNEELDYQYLGLFDKAMLDVVKSEKNFNKTPIQEIWHNDGDQILAFTRGDLLFVFNFSPTQSYVDYGLLVPTGTYDVVLNTDAKIFGGNELNDDSVTHFTNYDALYVNEHKEWLKLYIPARTAMVLKKELNGIFIENQYKAVCPTFPVPLIFVAFIFLYLYYYQSDTLTYVQHVLSNGKTHYNSLVGGIIITVISYIIVLLQQSFSKVIRRFRFISFYLPSCLLRSYAM